MFRDSIPYVRYTIYAIMNKFAAMLEPEEPNCPKIFFGVFDSGGIDLSAAGTLSLLSNKLST